MTIYLTWKFVYEDMMNLFLALNIRGASFQYQYDGRDIMEQSNEFRPKMFRLVLYKYILNSLQCISSK